jgi:hypothetical protein
MPHIKIYIGTLINSGDVYIIENNKDVAVVYQPVMSGVDKSRPHEKKIADKTSRDKIVRWAQDDTSNTEHIYSSLGAVLDDICKDE